MSDISVNLQRQNWIIDLRNLYIGAYDRCMFQFKTNNRFIEILSTSHGSIIEKTIHINSKASVVKAELEYLSDALFIECIISYFFESTMVHCDAVNIKPPQHPATYKKVKMQTMSWNEFNKQGVSRWKMNIQINNDILLTTIVPGESPTVMCFGEKSVSVNCTDIFYTAYPLIKTITVPKEAVQRHYDDYKSKELSCHEVVMIQDHEGLLCKLPVANVIEGHQLSKNTTNLVGFQSPTGKQFEPSLWTIGATGLPERLI